MFPTDQAADATDGSAHRLKTPPVSLTPHEALAESRNKFTMVIEKLAALGNRQQCVVEGSISRPNVDALTKADDDGDAVIFCGVLQDVEFFSRYTHAVRSHSGEHALGCGVSPKRGSRTEVQPNGVAR